MPKGIENARTVPLRPQPWLRVAETFDEIFLGYCPSPNKSGESGDAIFRSETVAWRGDCTYKVSSKTLERRERERERERELKGSV